MEQEHVGPRNVEYEDLMHWLDVADQTLQIVDQHVHNYEDEFLVSFSFWLVYMSWKYFSIHF